MKVSFVIHVRYLQGASVLYVRNVDRARRGEGRGCFSVDTLHACDMDWEFTQRAMKVIISWPTFDANCQS